MPFLYATTIVGRSEFFEAKVDLAKPLDKNGKAFVRRQRPGVYCMRMTLTADLQTKVV